MYSEKYSSPDEVIVCIPKKNIRYTNSAVLAYDKNTNRILSVGEAGLDRSFVESRDVEINSVCSFGRVESYILLERYTRAIFKMAYESVGAKIPFRRPKIAIFCYSGWLKPINEIESKVFEDLMYSALKVSSKVFLFNGSIEQVKSDRAFWATSGINPDKVDVFWEMRIPDSREQIKCKLDELVDEAQYINVSKAEIINMLSN